MRIGLAVAAFAFCAIGVPVVIFTLLDTSGFRRVEVGLDVADTIAPALAALHAGDDDVWDIAYLGDSMIVSYVEERRVTARLQSELDRLAGAPGRFRVHSLAAPGMGPFDYYLLADQIVASEPDQIVVHVNLTTLSDDWRGAFSRPELAGFIDPAEIPRALSLPLHWIGLTADRLLGYVAVVRAGLRDPWHRLVAQQARMGPLLRTTATSLAAAVGSEGDARFAKEFFRYQKDLVFARNENRLTPRGIRSRFGRALAGAESDGPVLRVLGAAIRVFREHRIDVVVYVNPVNVEHMQSIEADDPEGLAVTIASVEAVARDAGAEFVDLHRILEDADFRDPAGHLSVKHGRDGPLRLAEHLAPALFARSPFAASAGEQSGRH
jgi:hypothetical protein